MVNNYTIAKASGKQIYQCKHEQLHPQMFIMQSVQPPPMLAIRM